MSNYKAQAYKNDFPVTDGLIFYAPFEGSVNVERSVGTGTGTLTTANLKAIWHFEEGTGNDARDSSDNNRNLRVGTATWVDDGKYGSAITDTALVGMLGDQVDFDPEAGDFSLGCWVKPNDITPSRIAGIMRKPGLLTDNWGLDLNTDGTVSAYFTDAPNFVGATSDATLNEGEWNFLTATWDISAQKVSLYFDGVLEKSNTGSGVVNVNSTSAFTLYASYFLAGFEPIDGVTDEVFVFKGIVLTPGEVSFLHANRWHGSTFFSGGKFGLGYYAFEGNSLSYTANDGNILKDQGTIDMWVKPTWDGDDGVSHYFFNTETTSDRNEIQFSKISNQLNFSFRDNNGNNAALRLAVNGSNFPAGEQRHLVGTWENSEIKEMYMDGVLVDAIPSAAGVKLLRLDNTMTIGDNHASQGQETKGTIDEFKIYNRALTAAEVKQNFEATMQMEL